MLSNAAQKVSLAQEEATRAHTEVLATAEVAQDKGITSHTVAEPRTRATASEGSRVNREWKEGYRTRAAGVAAAARKSQEVGAAILRAKRVLAKPGDKHRRSGGVLAVAAAVAPYLLSAPAVVAAGTPY